MARKNDLNTNCHAEHYTFLLGLGGLNEERVPIELVACRPQIRVQSEQKSHERTYLTEVSYKINHLYQSPFVITIIILSRLLEQCYEKYR